MKESTMTTWNPVRWPYSDAPEYNADVYPCHARKLGPGLITLDGAKAEIERMIAVGKFD